MSGGSFLLIGVCMALGAALLIAGINYGREFLENARQPLQSQVAQVIARRVQEEQGSGWSPATLYYVTFQLPDGKIQEFSVPEQEYNHLREGGQGTLKTKGQWYNGFQSLTV